MANVNLGGEPVHNNAQLGSAAAGFGFHPSFGPLPGISADQDMFDPSNFPQYFQNMETPAINMPALEAPQIPDFAQQFSAQELDMACEIIARIQGGVPAPTSINIPDANVFDASMPDATPRPDSGAYSGASGSAPLPMTPFFGACGGLPLESPEINIVGQQAFVNNLAGPFPFGAEFIQSLPVAAVMPVEPPKPAPVTQGGVPAPDVNFVPGPNMQMFDLPIQGAGATPRPNSGATSGPPVSPPLPMTPRFQGSGGLPLASPQIGIVGQNNIGSGDLNITPEGGFPLGAGVTQSLPDLNDSKFPSVLKPVPAPEPPKPAPVRVVEAKDFPFPSVLHPVPTSMMSTGSESGSESESPNLAIGSAPVPNFNFPVPNFPVPTNIPAALSTEGGGAGVGPIRTPKRSRSQPFPTTSNAGGSGSKRSPKLRKTQSADSVTGPKPKPAAKVRKIKSADSALKGGFKAISGSKANSGTKDSGAKRAKKAPKAAQAPQAPPAADTSSPSPVAGPSKAVEPQAATIAHMGIPQYPFASMTGPDAFMGSGITQYPTFADMPDFNAPVGFAPMGPPLGFVPTGSWAVAVDLPAPLLTYP